MLTNDVLRSVRYMLDFSDAHIINIMAMDDFEAKPEDVTAWLKKDEEEGYAPCPPAALTHFLDGLVIFRRGKQENAPVVPVVSNAFEKDIDHNNINNNVVLKKLRVAFELKEENLHQIMEAAGFKISKPELSALFRKKGHKNYRACGDQFLRNFLKGLTLCIRG
ncbi:MAG TPA: DUF1456 family protein [Pseudomonadales bacterium]|nr:DUF1456 family protein [Pseudomonadales bacterium]